jgi:putative methylase
MKLRQLEMALQKVKGFENPDPRFEQYTTPAVLASRLLFDAFINGDIGGRSVLDLGCGTGVLSIGACLLGAEEVTGVDRDQGALRVAGENAAAFHVDIRFIQATIGDVPLITGVSPVDTVVMNPPFGAQKEHADRPFIDAALTFGRRVYAVFNSGSRGFVESYVRDRATVVSVTAGALVIPRTFSFHTRDRVEVPVEIILLERNE